MKKMLRSWPGRRVALWLRLISDWNGVIGPTRGALAGGRLSPLCINQAGSVGDAKLLSDHRSLEEPTQTESPWQSSEVGTEPENTSSSPPKTQRVDFQLVWQQFCFAFH